ncbi:MAG: thiamine pyrophosphate-binding protein, partial [Primorskyibacter sp.]
MTSLRARTGGQILVDQLLIHGATHGFCVPGESYLAVLDALYDVQDTFTLINARHEAGAANMADCWGKLTGRPGVAFVTRGPGATHAAVGVHIARQDSTPMVLLVGQVARDMRGREAFQEVDYRALFTPIAKWVDEVDDAARLPELMARAFRVAMSGRPGPVVLALPEDMLTDVVTVADAPPAVAARAGADDSDIARLRTAMAEAKRPMVIVGGNWADTQATLALTAWAEAQNIPVLSSFRRQDIIDNASPSYAGGLGTVAGPGLKARLREADGLLLLGTRLSEISTDGYAFPTPDTRIWHVYPEAEELGRVWTPEVEIVADAARFATRLAQAHTQPWGDWADWCATLRQDYL